MEKAQRSKIRTVICDDAVELCKGYEAYMRMSEDFICEAVAYNSEECCKIVQQIRPDLLLLDIQMEEIDSGIKLIPKLKQICADMKIVMLTGHADSEFVFRAVLNGAEGYVEKKMDGQAVLREVKEIYDNATVFSNGLQPEVIKTVLQESRDLYDQRNSIIYMMNSLVKLSTSEYEVLRDIYSGMSYKEIARKRVVEDITIRTTVARILKKFQVESMKELIASLRKLRFFDVL